LDRDSLTLRRVIAPADGRRRSRGPWDRLINSGKRFTVAAVLSNWGSGICEDQRYAAFFNDRLGGAPQ
jgi:hypothetical protein